MHRYVSILALAILLIGLTHTVSSGQSADRSAQTTNDRLVVFEAFLRPVCGNCQYAAPQIDRLAQEYEGRPVVFIEYDVDRAPGSRYSRWWAAHSGSSVTLPMTMVDGGFQISSGRLDFYTVYRGMVDAALTRPAQAEIEAYWWPDGSRAGFYIQVTNRSSVALTAANQATLHAIVYEEAQVQLTGRFGRSAVSTALANLAPNAVATFRLQSDNLSALNRDNLRFLSLVDYRPAGTSGAFDLLQAAPATAVVAPFAAQTDRLVFLVDPADVATPTQRLQFVGAGFVHWAATTDVPWLTVTPMAGAVDDTATVGLVREQLTTGGQTGEIALATSDGLFSETVTVYAHLGTVERVYLPIAFR